MKKISKEILMTKRANEEKLLSLPNVVGVGVGLKETNGTLTDEISVVVMVREKKDVAELGEDELVPETLGGVKTDVIEVGDIKALYDPAGRMHPLIQSVDFSPLMTVFKLGLAVGLFLVIALVGLALVSGAWALRLGGGL